MLSNYFDTVIISHVLEHTLCPDQILNIAQQVVKNNGEIIVVLPLSLGNDPTHIRYISPEEMKDKLNKIGKVGRKYIVGTKGCGLICKVKK